MDKDIVAGNIGTVGKYDFKVEKGNLELEIDAGIPVGSVGIVVKLNAGEVLDAIAKAIPGTLDDALLGIAKAALLG